MLKHRSAVPTMTLVLALAASVWGVLPAGAAEGTKPAGDAKPAPPAKAATVELYRLRPGDEVSISVTPQKDYDCAGVILPDGRVYLRTVGPIKAVGLSIPELEMLLRKKLDEDLVDPEVRVALVHIAPDAPEKPVEMPKLGRITIVGAVGRTGPMELEEGLRLRKALDLAGGAGREADLTHVAIIHPDLRRTIVDISTAERVSDPKSNLILKDGDSIEVPLLPPAPVALANPVRISGQVTNPGQFDLKQGMTLEDLLITAGRPTTLADLSHVELRRTGQAPKIINLTSQQDPSSNGGMRLEAADEIVVPELKNTVLIIGAVQTPGARGLKTGMTVRDFFLDPAQAVTINPSSQNLDHVRIIRQGAKEPFRVDLDGVLKKPARKDNIALQPGDVIFISPRDTTQQGGLMNNLSRWLPTTWLLQLLL
jgi:polysaccharide export outer membrane protein